MSCAGDYIDAAQYFTECGVPVVPTTMVGGEMTTTGARTSLDIGRKYLQQGDYVRAERSLSLALFIANRVRDQATVAEAMMSLGVAAHYKGIYARATSLYGFARNWFTRMGGPMSPQVSIINDLYQKAHQRQTPGGRSGHA